MFGLLNRGTCLKLFMLVAQVSCDAGLLFCSLLSMLRGLRNSKVYVYNIDLYTPLGMVSRHFGCGSKIPGTSKKPIGERKNRPSKPVVCRVPRFFFSLTLSLFKEDRTLCDWTRPGTRPS